MNPFRTTVVLHCAQTFGDRFVGNFVDTHFGVVKDLKVSVIVRAPKPFPMLIPSEIVPSKGFPVVEGLRRMVTPVKNGFPVGLEPPNPSVH